MRRTANITIIVLSIAFLCVSLAWASSYLHRITLPVPGQLAFREIASVDGGVHFIIKRKTSWQSPMAWGSVMIMPWRCGGFGVLWEGSPPHWVIRSVTIPYWFLTLCAALPSLLLVYKRVRSRPIEGLCLKCGYDLRGTHAACRSICPECGTANQPPSKHGSI